jgi:hypothetical protein
MCIQFAWLALDLRPSAFDMNSVPNNARLYGEEAGNRRPLANWSETGV